MEQVFEQKLIQATQAVEAQVNHFDEFEQAILNVLCLG
jgi:hypothetical protein